MASCYLCCKPKDLLLQFGGSSDGGKVSMGKVGKSKCLVLFCSLWSRRESLD